MRLPGGLDTSSHLIPGCTSPLIRTGRSNSTATENSFNSSPIALSANPRQTSLSASDPEAMEISKICSSAALLRAMDKFSFPDAWSQVVAGRDKMFPSTTCKALADKIRKFLSRKLPAVARKAAA
jgi:hypothetical protein